MASGTYIHIEPIKSKEVILVMIGGRKEIYGFSGKSNKKITT
ncbi:MAG: urease subunit beta [Flavobacteriales bacterium AspAUS03]